MTAHRHHFDVEVRVELERPHTLRAIGTYTEGTPANRRGHPDYWTPAEGGEIDWLRLSVLRGDRSREVDPGRMPAGTLGAVEKATWATLGF